MKETLTHVFFWGGIYSQWYKVSFVAKEEGDIVFSSAEQFMMYKKAMLFQDLKTAEAILKTSDPKKQKALGRKVQGFKEKIWDLHKFSIVVQGNYYKFSQNEKLKEELLKTKLKVLVEGSPYDKVWGVGLKWDDTRILDPSLWQGQNLLGRALMEVREKLK